MFLLLMVALNIQLKTPVEEVTLKVQLPQTLSERVTGLSRAENLPLNEGMLFTFEKEALHCFTMKNTSIPLALLFFDNKFQLVDMQVKAPFDTKPIYPNTPCQYVLEVNPSLTKKICLRPHETSFLFFKKKLDD
ncbi:MAG: hypothetical protein S4CHLAM7_12630 [Chlamydiae bacterium]|nr:hypothetical protein [Chlamydiota bacterium]